MQKQLEPIIRKMSEELGVPFDVCVQAYMSQWHFILEKVNSMEMKEMTLEELTQTKRNFNLPSIGKLCVTERRFLNVQKKLEIIRQKRQENVQNQEGQADVQSGGDDNEQV